MGLLMTHSTHASPEASAKESGFFLPDETTPHQRTFMQWPANRRIHADSAFLDDLQSTIARLANTISAFEPVVMLMADEHAAAARGSLAGSVDIWNIPTDDLWCRDSGPTFLIDGRGGLAIADLNFNGWGNKQVHIHDGAIARRVAGRLGVTVFDNDLVGEAGGVEQDGVGTLLAHESSWVVANRNIGSKPAIEAKLLAALGAQTMIWAPGVKGADITDFHIDALARFVRPGVVLIQMPERIEPGDPWSKAAFETFSVLKTARDARGLPLEIVTLPEPKRPRIRSNDFVASYVNYYVCNGAVVCAEFGDDKADRAAVETLKQLYPGRAVVAQNVDAIGECGGGIHCATHEQPRV